MEIENKFLFENDLTSTKNTFLEHDIFITFKRRNIMCCSNQQQELLSTENKFLIKDIPPTKKRKKRKTFEQNEYLETRARKYKKKLLKRISDEERSRGEPDSPEFCDPEFSDATDGVNFAEAQAINDGDISKFQFQYSKFSEDTVQTSQAYASCPSQGFTFGSAPQQAAFGGFSMPRSLRSDGAPRCFPGVLNSDLVRDHPHLRAKEQHINIMQQMPSYKLKSVEFMPEEADTFKGNFEACDETIIDLKVYKLHLLNIVSMSLMCSPQMKSYEDTYRQVLIKAAENVRKFDPEFILKVALYARQELNIRAVANFLLSYAALYDNTRCYLRKYFDASIVLPSDWIDVAHYFQTFTDEEIRVSLPAALRCAMIRSFPKFDSYQLAKYNKKTKSKKRDAKDSSENLERQRYTLKQLIRLLHINSPAEHVMCLLGKKYPENYETFKSSGLPGSWDHSKSGQRMKLPVPETWETELSLKGNKSCVWENLIERQKLPYMAMLRNLRNLILSGISLSHHKKVLKYLENKNAVTKSRQLPLQYYEAYKVIVELQRQLHSEQEGSNVKRKMSLHKYCAWMDKMSSLMEKLGNVSDSLLKSYKTSIINAIEISALSNLSPVPGKTLIICEVVPSIGDNIEKKLYETVIMNGLMCLKACENGKMHIIAENVEPRVISLKEDENFLDIMINISESYQFAKETSHCPVKKKDSLKTMLSFYLRPKTFASVKFDHVVFLLSDPECSETENIMSSFLFKYREMVNSDLLYTNVNFTLKNRFADAPTLSTKDVFLCGSSSHLVKFIAERSENGQLTYIENIDEKYELPDTSLQLQSSLNNEINEPPPIIYSNLPTWHSIRIFVSSTFKDMISERDLLIRYVFPELRKRALNLFFKITEIDLRWGISESDCSTKRASEICLLEAQKSDLFVGFLGERYGTTYKFDAPDDPDLQWVTDLASGLSLTELEMHAAALRHPDVARKRAFFYFRDNSFMKGVPDKWISYFASEDEESKLKLESLKEKIKVNDFKVMNGYNCHFAGVYEDKPILAGLDDLANEVLEDLWNAVQEVKNSKSTSEYAVEEMSQQELINSQNFYIEDKSLPLTSVMKALSSKQSIFLISGQEGCGKTAFTIELIKKIKNIAIVSYFIGPSPSSRNLSYMLKYICFSICQQFSISMKLPDLTDDIIDQFPDILIDMMSSCGGRSLILIIDGLEHLNNDDQMLDWLPLLLPSNLKLICTASESSTPFEVLSEREKHKNTIFILNLPALQHSDREFFISNYLKNYSKTVEESAFNNHMLKLVTKRSSSNPFYLRSVCDFLRIYASFENINSIIQKLPSTTVNLFEEVIMKLESEFGSLLVQTALTILCITDEGIEDNDLYLLLSFVSSKNDKRNLLFHELKSDLRLLDPKNVLTRVQFCSLMHLISTFAFGRTRKQCMNFCSTQFEAAVKKFYLNKNYITNCKYLHSILAAYFYTLSDPKNDETHSGLNKSSIKGMLYHLHHGGFYVELSNLLSNYKFLEAAFKTKVNNELLEYYCLLLFDAQITQSISRDIDLKSLTSFYRFVSRNFHIFNEYPQLILQQAVNEPDDSTVYISNKNSLFCLENISKPKHMRLATVAGSKIITAAFVDKSKSLALLGSENGCLKLLDLNTRKVFRSFKAHTSAITAICKAGKDRFCTASTDKTLSLWNAASLTRVAVLKGHQHNVTSCCDDPFDSIILSSGWDNSVHLWSVVDGRLISVFEFRCPVNDISHHPHKHEIACGLWNGNIEIWDTVSMKKTTVMYNSSGSVKSIVYTSDGVNIIASYMELEVIVWSTEENLKITTLKGHISPVNTIVNSFYENIFISGSEDCTLKIWPISSGHIMLTIPECKFCPVHRVEFISDIILAVCFQNSEIWIIDISNGSIISKCMLKSDMLSEFGKFYNTKKSVDTNFFNKSVIFGTASGKIMIWNYSDSSDISSLADIKSKITAIIYNHYLVFCGNMEGHVALVSYPENQFLTVIADAHTGFVSSLSFALCGEELVSISTASDNVLKLWKLDSNGDALMQNQEFNKHKDLITCSGLCLYESTECTLNNLFTGSHDNNIICWTPGSEKIFKGLQTSVLQVACSKDYILGCGNDGSVAIWSQNGTLLSMVPGISFSSTIMTFYVASDCSDEYYKFDVSLAYVDTDGSIVIKKPLKKLYSHSLDGHNKGITCCFVTDNREVVSCSHDGTMNLWTMPVENTEKTQMHLSAVTSVWISKSCEFAASSDAHGNFVIWNINISSNTPLRYATKKSYINGFIVELSGMHDNTIVCAVNQTVSDEEKYFIDVWNFKLNTVNENEVLLQLIKSYNFEDEISCITTYPSDNSIFVGFKTGCISVIVGAKQLDKYKLHSDWILKVCGFSTFKCCAALTTGKIVLFDIPTSINTSTTEKRFPFLGSSGAQVSSLISALCSKDGYLYAGDTQGALNIYDMDSSTLVAKAEVHSDSITAICFVGPYMFTSSLDKTVKGWNATTKKQICQFHSDVPISSMAVPKMETCDESKIFLLIGSTTGSLNLLKFHKKK